MILPQAALRAACGVEIGHAAAGQIGGIARALAGIRRLAPPIAIEIERIDRGGQIKRWRNLPAVTDRASIALGVEAVVRKRIAERVGGEFRRRQSGIGDLTVLFVDGEARDQFVVRRKRALKAQAIIVELEIVIVADAIKAGGADVTKRAEARDRAAQRERCLAIAAVAAGEEEAAAEFIRRAR